MNKCRWGVFRRTGLVSKCASSVKLAVLITSESGLSNMGPVPSPATKRERPRVHTSREDPNSGSSWPYVDV